MAKKKNANGRKPSIELVGLSCAACGSNALGNFVGGVAKCQSCGTTNILLGFGKKLKKDLPTNGDVVVEIPPSIAIGELLRANQIPAATYRIEYDEDYPEDWSSGYPSGSEDAEIYDDFLNDEDETVLDESGMLAIGKVEETEAEEEKVHRSGFLNLVRSVEKLVVPEKLVYFPIDILLEELPYTMKVYGREHMDYAQKIGKLIQEKLGYSVKVSLKHT